MCGGGIVLVLSLPSIGNQASRAAKTSWRMIANQNTGSAVPRIDAPRTRWVPTLRGHQASAIPAMTPKIAQTRKL